MTSLTVVTPWKNHPELTRGYWHAIHAAHNIDVLVIDDGSEPPLPNAVRIAPSGFSVACNTGLDLAQSDGVLFLNNDIALTKPGWDIPVREALEEGVLVGAELRYDPHGSVEETPLPYLDGWCLAGFRRDLLELGGFDETYDEPAYYSDNDLCLRARLAGMTLREVKVGLRHKKNATAGPSTDEHVMAATLANRQRFQQFAREALAEVV